MKATGAVTAGAARSPESCAADAATRLGTERTVHVGAASDGRHPVQEPLGVCEARPPVRDRTAIGPRQLAVGVSREPREQPGDTPLGWVAVVERAQARQGDRDRPAGRT